MNVQLNDIYEVITYCYCGNQEGINVRYLQITALAPAAVSQQNFANDLSDAFATYYPDLMQNDAEYLGVAIRWLNSGGPLPAQIYSISGQTTGVGGVGGLPAQTCGIYTVNTGFAGRKYRGRSYIPFPAADQSTGDAIPKPSAAYITALGILADFATGQSSVVAGGGTLDFTWQLFHKATKTFTPTTTYTARSAWATQRRRGGYGRPNPQPLP